MKKEIYNRKTTRLKNYKYDTGVYFVTICTEDRKRVLASVVGTDVLDGPKKINVELLPYGKTADKIINQLNDFYDNIDVKAYVIMPDHIHILLYIKESMDLGPSGTSVPTIQKSSLSWFVSTFKRFCNKEYGHNVWQKRSADHIIRNREDYEEHVKYIHENPLRWYYKERLRDKTK